MLTPFDGEFFHQNRLRANVTIATLDRPAIISMGKLELTGQWLSVEIEKVVLDRHALLMAVDFAERLETAETCNLEVGESEFRVVVDAIELIDETLLRVWLKEIGEPTEIEEPQVVSLWKKLKGKFFQVLRKAVVVSAGISALVIALALILLRPKETVEPSEVQINEFVIESDDPLVPE